jgi:O-antigen/teichoic acid export membrane protein
MNSDPVHAQDVSARGRGRYKRIFDAATSGILSKAVLLLVAAITVPLTVRYLGAEQYGIWITISTTMTLLAVMDLGIANTLTNLISEAFAKESKVLAGRYAATAFWAVMLISILLGVAGWLLWPHLNWTFLFHLRDQELRDVTSRAIAVAYAVFLVGLPAGLATKLLGGYQELRAANLFASLGGVFSLIAVIVVIRLHGSIAMLVLGYAGAIVGANVLCLLWLWLWHKPWLAPLPGRLDRSLVRRIVQSGGLFFLLQISSLVVFNSDNLVIAHYLNTAAVTPYSVTWRIGGLAGALQMLIVPALWPAYSEAYTRGEMEWIRKTYRHAMRLTVGVAVAFCAFFAVLGRTIIYYWAGSAAVPEERLVLAMCLWFVLSTVMNNQACLLVAANEIRLQAWVSMLAAALNLAATIWLVQRIGTVGVILGTVVSYLLIIVGPQSWKVRQVLKKQSPA